MSLSPQSADLIQALRKVVASSYALLAQTHMCHWNVRGPGFFALHDAFEMQYTELFQGIDAIAERIRSLDALAPGGLGALAGMAGMEELREDAAASEMVKHLADCNRLVVEHASVARECAAAADDKETEDMMIARIQIHEKTIWMLKSFLDV